MAFIGDKGRAMAGQRPIMAYNPFTRTKSPTSVDIHIVDAPDGAIIALTTRGAPVKRMRADSTGVHFYDMDDGDYLAYTVFDGTPGLAWSINVTGTVVTITRISTSGIVAAWTFG